MCKNSDIWSDLIDRLIRSNTINLYSQEPLFDISIDVLKTLHNSIGITSLLQYSQIMNEIRLYYNDFFTESQAKEKEIMYLQGGNPFKKKMGKFKHSDAPDAKGKFKSMSPSGLASWLIKTRKGNLSRIISSLNQQVVFNRGKNPSYARKMKTTMNIVRKRIGKKK